MLLLWCQLLFSYLTVIDLKVIKTGVDYVFDKFVGDVPDNDISVNSNKSGILARKDDLGTDGMDDIDLEVYLKKQSKQRNLRNGVTALVGAVMQKQQCWENTACRIGYFLEPMAAKEVIFM